MVKDSQTSKLVEKTKLSRMSWPRNVVFAVCLFATLGFSRPISASSAADTLETRVWTSNLSDSAQLERTIVRKLQENPEAYEHYLVAELSLRMFKNNPSDLRYLRQASEMSQQAIELSPNKEFGYLVAAQVLDLMGYKNEANEMLAERPSFGKGWRTSFVRGVLASSQNVDQGSLKEFATTIQAPDYDAELVGIFVANGLEASYSGAGLVVKLEEWRKHLDTSAIQMSLARALDETGKNKEAHQLLASLNKAHPSYEGKFADAVILYTKLKNHKDAQKLFTDIVTNAPEDEMKVAAKAHLGKISLQKGDVKTASKMFESSIALTEERLKWIAFSHKAYTESAKLQDFAVLLDTLRTQLPGSSYLYALQGEVLSESLAQHAKAVESFAAAITLDPKRSEFYNGMGLAYYRMHENDKALATFNKALSIDPKDATARYNEACVLALMGRGEEAVGSLKQAISLDGRLQNVAMKDKDFAGIRSNAQFQTIMQDPSVTMGH